MTISILMLSSFCYSQTPIANRVKAMANKLPKGTFVVAKYTDDARHCLYYVMHNRLYRYDVLKDKSQNVEFATDGYLSIIDTFTSPDGNYLFIAVDNGSLASFYPDDGQELWRINSRTLRALKIGEGFKVEKRDDCLVIRKFFRCLNPKDPINKQKWMARDHYFDLYGHVNYAKDEYRINIRMWKK